MTSDALEGDNYCSSVATVNCDIAAASFDAEIQQEMLLVWPYPRALDTKFLGIHVDSTLSWKIHIEQIIPKLSAAC
jgi:hypothetical protein